MGRGQNLGDFVEIAFGLLLRLRKALGRRLDPGDDVGCDASLPPRVLDDDPHLSDHFGQRLADLCVVGDDSL